MKKIKMFYLERCPHCKNAFKMLDELKTKNPEYTNLEIEYIEESKNKKIAGAYDYYYVPTFYVGEEKMLEGVPKLDKVKAVLDAALR